MKNKSYYSIRTNDFLLLHGEVCLVGGSNDYEYISFRQKESKVAMII